MKVGEAVICLDCDEIFSIRSRVCPKCCNSKTFSIKTVLPSMSSTGLTDTVVLKDIKPKRGKRSHAKQVIPDERRSETLETAAAVAL